MNRPFSIGGLIAIAAVLSVAFAGLVAGAGWHGGFLSGQALANHLPPLFWEYVTTLGDERVVLALMLPFALRYPRVFANVVFAALIAGLACRIVKTGLPMPRPAALLDPAQITVIGWRLKGLSFPSGHTASAFAAAVVWLAALGWKRGWPLLLLAALAGFSRVAVGAHWPVDVLGGALVGTAGAWLALRLAGERSWQFKPRAHLTLLALGCLGVATLPFEGQGYPGSLPWRVVACLWGLGGALAVYWPFLQRGGAAALAQHLAAARAAATKA